MRHRFSSKFSSVIPLLGLAAWLGCNEAAPPPTPRPEPEPTIESSAAAPESERPSVQEQIPPLAGELSVLIEGDRASIRAGNVPRLRVVRALAEAGDFEVEGSTANDRLTLHHVETPLSQVLQELLAGQAFSTDWAVAETAGRPHHRLVALRLQADAVNDPTDLMPSEPETGAEVISAEQMEEEQREREAPPPRPADAPKDQDTLLGQLQSSDPEDRMEALVEMDTRGFGTDEVIAALDDPDLEVRITALERLAEDETFVGTAAIVDSLRSDDSEIVIRSVDLLVNTGDPSLVGAISPLLFHRDPKVRLAAEEALVDLDDAPRDLPPSAEIRPDE